MKNIEELRKTARLLILRTGTDGGQAEAYLHSSKKNTPATVVFSWGGGWDHVSVSFRNRCPSWEEMSEIKGMFFHPEEVCVEYHPAESEYVNDFPYCLHIWRPQNEVMPTPPSWMVGRKKGQTMAQVFRVGNAALEQYDKEQLPKDPRLIVAELRSWQNIVRDDMSFDEWARREAAINEAADLIEKLTAGKYVPEETHASVLTSLRVMEDECARLGKVIASAMHDMKTKGWRDMCKICKYCKENEPELCDEFDFDCEKCTSTTCMCVKCRDMSHFIWRGLGVPKGGAENEVHH